MYKRKLHSKFRAIPIRKLFFFAVTFSFFFQRASPAVFCNAPPYLPSYLLSRYTFCAAGGIGIREVTFRGLVSQVPPRARVVTTFLTRLRTKYKNPPETSITRSHNRQNKTAADTTNRAANTSLIKSLVKGRCDFEPIPHTASRSCYVIGVNLDTLILYRSLIKY